MVSPFLLVPVWFTIWVMQYEEAFSLEDSPVNKIKSSNGLGPVSECDVNLIMILHK